MKDFSANFNLKFMSFQHDFQDAKRTFRLNLSLLANKWNSLYQTSHLTMENFKYETETSFVTQSCQIHASNFPRQGLRIMDFIPKTGSLIKPWLIAITIRCLFLIHVLKSACFVFITNNSRLFPSLSWGYQKRWNRKWWETRMFEGNFCE